MASLAQTEVTQAMLVRTLSRYARQPQTKKALWDLAHLCRTLYSLDCIDDVALRQSGQKALNRGAASHRFRRAIAYVHAGKFRVKTEAEQPSWHECSRLMAHAVIYDNTALLARVYAHKRAAGDQQALALLSGISPVAWQHVHLFGTCEFRPPTSTVDIDALAARYADPVYWDKALPAESAIRCDSFSLFGGMGKNSHDFSGGSFLISLRASYRRSMRCPCPGNAIRLSR
jgi:Tn3 transposase DDE domain